MRVYALRTALNTICKIQGVRRLNCIVPSIPPSLSPLNSHLLRPAINFPATSQTKNYHVTALYYKDYHCIRPLKRHKRRGCVPKKCEPRTDYYKKDCPQKIVKGYYNPCLKCGDICGPQCIQDDPCDPWAGTRRSCEYKRRVKRAKKLRVQKMKNKIPIRCED